MGERFPRQVKHTYTSMNLDAFRAAGDSTGTITAHGRSNAAERQEVADRMASITETATVTRTGEYTWTVAFQTTHRVLPIEN